MKINPSKIWKKTKKTLITGFTLGTIITNTILSQNTIPIKASIWNEDGKPITTGTIYFQATNSPKDSITLNGNNTINTNILGIEEKINQETINKRKTTIAPNIINQNQTIKIITNYPARTEELETKIYNIIGQEEKNNQTLPAGMHIIRLIDNTTGQTINNKKIIITNNSKITTTIITKGEYEPPNQRKKYFKKTNNETNDSIKIWTKIPGHEKNNNYTIIRKPGQKMNEINLGQSNYNKNTGKVDTAKISLEELINTINEKGEIRIYCISDTALNDTIKSQMVPGGVVRRFTQPYTIEIVDVDWRYHTPIDTNTINKMIEINEDFKETMKLTNGDTLITFNYKLVGLLDNHPLPSTPGDTNIVLMYQDANAGYPSHSEFFLDPNNPFRTTGGVNVTLPNSPYSVIAEEYYGNHLRSDGLVGGLAAYIIAGEGMYEVRLNNKGKKALRTLYLLNPGSKVPPIGYDATKKQN